MSNFNAVLTSPVNVEMFAQSPVSSVFGRIGNIEAQEEDYAEFYAPLGSGNLPIGGVTGQALVKLSNNDFDVDWGDIGAVNTIFGRTGNVTAEEADYESFYALISQAIPVGGTTGQVLAKDTNANYDVSWQDPTPSGVDTFNGRSGTVVPLSGDYSAFYPPLGTQMPTGGTTGQILAKNSNTNYDAVWITSPLAPVSSVFGRTGVITAQSGDYSIGQITGANASNWDAAFTERRQWDGGSANLVAATGRTSLGGTTLGQNFFTVPNPSAIRYPRANADNSLSMLSAATLATDLGVVADILRGATILVDAVNGNNSTGTRGSSVKPFLTIPAALLVAVSGDVVYVGPGTFNLSTVPLVVPAGVTLVGAGAGASIITGAPLGLSRCVVELLTGASISDFTIQSTTTTGAPIGVGTAGTAFADATISNCLIIGKSNGIYINKTGSTGLNVYNSIVTVFGDAIAVLVAGQFNFYQCDLISDGATTSASRGINATNGTVYFSESTITVGNCPTENGSVRTTGSGANVTLDGVKLDTGFDGTTNYDIVATLGATLGINNIFRADGASLVISGTVTELSRYQLHDAQLDSLAALSYSGNALKVIRVNSGGTGFELVTSGGATTAGLFYFADVDTLKTTGTTLISKPTAGGVIPATSMAIINTGEKFRLDTGAGNTSDPGQGQPADYNASTNDVHWIQVS